MGVFAAVLNTRSFRRWFASLLVVLVIVYLLSDRSASLKSHHGGLGSSASSPAPLRLKPDQQKEDGGNGQLSNPSASTTQPPTLTLVIASLAKEDTTWAHTLTSSMPNLTPEIYIVDAPSNTSLIPLNKGHEAMPYLTHIITHYDALPDVTLFMHAHQYTWHNNDLLASDSAQIVRHLNPAKVLRDGYVNLRCHHDPGCPTHLRPASVTEATADINRPEELHVANAWRELFPGTPVPKVLSQPCCAQFALSRQRLRSVPLAEYVRHRDWIVGTHLDDAVAGRVWEYVWQFLWTGLWEFCPAQHVCYCDLYGACFGDRGRFDEWFRRKARWKELWKELDAMEGGDGDEQKKERAVQIKKEMGELDTVLEAERVDAFERGRNPMLRALDSGRAWKVGDGF